MLSVCRTEMGFLYSHVSRQTLGRTSSLDVAPLHTTDSLRVSAFARYLHKRPMVTFYGGLKPMYLGQNVDL
jgi:hypothetical protein